MEVAKKLEFCWSCRKDKENVDATKGNFYSGICQDCIIDFETALKNSNMVLIQRDRPPHYSSWHGKDVIIRDVLVKRTNEEYFIRGFHTCDASYETSEVFNLAKQFLQNNAQYVRFYGNFETLEKYDFWFYVQKSNQFYHFGGNCLDISNAFSLKTLDLNQIWKYIEVWTKIPESLKKRIKEQLDKGLEFCSSTKSFDRNKHFCFKDYSQNIRDPKIIILKNFKP